MNGYSQPTRQLVSQQDAATIEAANRPRSTFINRWTRKTSFDAGKLIPFLVDEILPGDHVRYNIQAYLRLSTPLFPIFDQQRVDTHFFFVPNRLLWENWEVFMGQQNYPGQDPTAYAVPYIAGTTGGAPIGDIEDHFGLPTINQVVGGNWLQYCALPFRAYNQIYNAWYRDENVGTPMARFVGDSGDTIANYGIGYRMKSHDYFTSALPWPQKFAAPLVPLGTTAPIIGLGKFDPNYAQGPITVYQSDGTNPTYPIAAMINPGAVNQQFYVKGSATTTGYPQIYADLSQASGISINTLRQAWMVQTLLERDARGGTRYPELIWSHFRVRNPDYRVQRPEYIGGGSSNLNITPIAQTAPTTGVPLGALGAAGTAAGTHAASYAATEHGFILGIISVKSELSYQSGMHKLWKRRTRYDFYWPELAELGEQPILRQEIYAEASVGDLTVWGYQARWEEYRTRYSDVTGRMRSYANANTLDAWHLAQKLTNTVALNETFLRDAPPMSRILAAADLATLQQYLVDIQYNRTITRVMPTYGTPSSMSRF